VTFKLLEDMGDVLISPAEVTAILLFWEKFHIETDCGKGGDHWAECDRISEMFGAQ
jgi:hypothetical protein